MTYTIEDFINENPNAKIYKLCPKFTCIKVTPFFKVNVRDYNHADNIYVTKQGQEYGIRYRHYSKTDCGFMGTKHIFLLNKDDIQKLTGYPMESDVICELMHSSLGNKHIRIANALLVGIKLIPEKFAKENKIKYDPKKNMFIKSLSRKMVTKNNEMVLQKNGLRFRLRYQIRGDYMIFDRDDLDELRNNNDELRNNNDGNFMIYNPIYIRKKSKLIFFSKYYIWIPVECFI